MQKAGNVVGIYVSSVPLHQDLYAVPDQKVGRIRGQAADHNAGKGVHEIQMGIPYDDG